MRITADIHPPSRENNLRLATVQTVDLERFTATVVDSFGTYFEVTLRTQPTRLPCKGETWLLDRSAGYFTFMAPIDSRITTAKKFTTAVGDGVSSTFDVEHGLGTFDVVVNVYKASGVTDDSVQVFRVSADVVSLVFFSVVGEDEYRVTIIG